MGVAQGVEPALDGRSHGTLNQPPHEDEVQRRLSQLDVHSGLTRPHYSKFRTDEKKAQRALFAPFLFVAVGCGRSRLKFSRLSFPTDKATSRWREVRACSQRVFCKRRLLRSLRLRVAEGQFIGQPHLLPRTLLPQRNFGNELANPQRETQIPRWIALDRNDLGEFSYGRANKQTARPCRLGIEPSWLLSRCLTSASSRSVRTR